MTPSLPQVGSTPQVGSLVRTLARFSPGMRTTADQIPDFHRYWMARNTAALASGRRPWVVLGDSLGQGIGASAPENGYVGLLHRRWHQSSIGADTGPGSHPVVNLSRSGARIGHVLDHQLPALGRLETDPLLVMVTIGNNDLLRTATDRRLLRGLEQLLAALTALPGCSVVATLPQLGSLRAKSINRKLRVLASRHGVGCAAVGTRLSSWRGRQATDRFHPNDAGYRVWAEAFLSTLAETCMESGPTQAR